MSLDDYILSLKNYKGFAGDIVCHRTIAQRVPIFADPGLRLTHDLGPLLDDLGIDQLYIHQNLHFPDSIAIEGDKVEETGQSDFTLSGNPELRPGPRYGVLDIETRRSAKEVGGWNRAERMGVSCAVLYDSKSDKFHTFYQEDMQELCQHLLKLDLVIGFNIISFDYKVLSGLSSFDFHGLPTLDLLTKVHEILGYRLSLDHLAQQTLGCKKSADGLAALEWWKQGKMEKIVEYCTQDVLVTRDLYRFGNENHFLLFKNKAEQEVRIPVKW